MSALSYDSLIIEFGRVWVEIQKSTHALVDGQIFAKQWVIWWLIWKSVILIAIGTHSLLIT